jgi:hypothetical protein
MVPETVTASVVTTIPSREGKRHQREFQGDGDRERARPSSRASDVCVVNPLTDVESAGEPHHLNATEWKRLITQGAAKTPVEKG